MGVASEIAGPVATATVALAALYAAEVRSKRELRHGRRLDDLRAVRDVLDEAAVALNRADYAQRDVVTGYKQFGRKLHEQKSDAVQELKLTGQQIDVLAQRLKVRLGQQHKVARTFAGATEDILAIWRQVAWLEDDGPEQKQQRRTALDAAAERFERHWNEFLDAASSSAGVELGESDKPTQG
jgi:hypothetical protein